MAQRSIQDFLPGTSASTQTWVSHVEHKGSTTLRRKRGTDIDVNVINVLYVD